MAGREYHYRAAWFIADGLPMRPVFLLVKKSNKNLFTREKQSRRFTVNIFRKRIHGFAFLIGRTA
jgi:hypothetical protein